MSAPSDVETLRGQIEQHRAELGDTVEALTAKFDVNAVGRYFAEAIRSDMIERAQKMIERIRQRVRSVRGEATGLPRRALSRSADVPGADVPGADVPGADAPGADGPGSHRRAVADAVAGAVVGAGIAGATYALARQYRRSAAAR